MLPPFIRFVHFVLYFLEYINHSYLKILDANSMSGLSLNLFLLSGLCLLILGIQSCLSACLIIFYCMLENEYKITIRAPCDVIIYQRNVPLSSAR